MALPPAADTLSPERRARILEGAARVFAREGYEGASMAGIASETGVSKGTLYNYFPSKQKLFGACVDHVIRGLSATVGKSDNDNPLEQVENLVRSFLTYFHSNPRYVELLMRERSDFPQRQGETYMQFRKERRKAWSQRFAKWMEDGTFRRMEPDRAVDVMLNLLYGTIFSGAFQHGQATLNRQVQDVVDILFRGLLAVPRGHRKKPTLSY